MRLSVRRVPRGVSLAIRVVLPSYNIYQRAYIHNRDTRQMHVVAPAKGWQVPGRVTQSRRDKLIRMLMSVNPFNACLRPSNRILEFSRLHTNKNRMVSEGEEWESLHIKCDLKEIYIRPGSDTRNSDRRINDSWKMKSFVSGIKDGKNKVG